MKIFISFTYRKRFGRLGTGCLAGESECEKPFEEYDIDSIIKYIRANTSKHFRDIVPIYVRNQPDGN